MYLIFCTMKKPLGKNSRGSGFLDYPTSIGPFVERTFLYDLVPGIKAKKNSGHVRCIGWTPSSSLIALTATGKSSCKERLNLSPTGPCSIIDFKHALEPISILLLKELSDCISYYRIIMLSITQGGVVDDV